MGNLLTRLGTSPELHELQLLTFGEGKESVRIMERVIPKWKQLAIAFGFNGSRIEAIEMGALRQPGDACLKMFTDWLAGGHDLQPPTWDALILSLRVAKLTEVADLLSSTIKTVSLSSILVADSCIITLFREQRVLMLMLQ